MITRRTALPVSMLMLIAACESPMSVLTSSGKPGGDEAWLGRIFAAVGIAVLIVVIVLLVVSLFRRRPAAAPGEIVRSGHGIPWILAGGVIGPAVILVTLFLFVLTSLSTTAQPPESNLAGTFEIVGHRWWWEVRRVDDTGQRQFVAANELHIPVGRPVRLHLSSADVIHSFWVPQLAGKTDLIPGKVNDAWIEADTAGVYIAQCAEYCGMQHAHMAMRVVAESDAKFERWLATQSSDAHVPDDEDEQRGLAAFVTSPCASCHQIRGTSAGAIVGPDLTHFGSRLTIGAGVAPNTEGHLAAWIANSQTLKPGNDMPVMHLKSGDLHAIVEYLRSLE